MSSQFTSGFSPVLVQFIQALEAVEGVSAVVLGGSRARGTATATSDYDLGLYYEPHNPLNVPQLQAVISPFVDEPSTALVTPLGEWGPWINGGGWLTVDGQKVDVLYRDLERVEAVVAQCLEGHIAMEYQPGHPHGFCSAIWMGEVAICRPLFDPQQRVARLKEQTAPFPPQLRDAIIARFQWEIGFSTNIAQGSIGRGDQTHIAGCVYRALCCIAQVLFALNHRYLINEKGALAEASTFPITIEGLPKRIEEIWALLGKQEFSSLIAHLRSLTTSLDHSVVQAKRNNHKDHH